MYCDWFDDSKQKKSRRQDKLREFFRRSASVGCNQIVIMVVFRKMNSDGHVGKVTHVIFDLDGVLLDTEPLYTTAIQKVVSRYGKTFDWSIKLNVMGLTSSDTDKKIVELLDLKITPEEFNIMAEEEYDVVEKQAKIIPGAEILVKHLYQHQVPMAIATSSPLDSFESKTENYREFFSLFHHVVAGSTDCYVKEGKPKPDIYLECASRFPEKPQPANCLVFEDSPNGVKAAVSAGMFTVMVPDENVPIELYEGANLIVSSLDQTPLEVFELPAMNY